MFAAGDPHLVALEAVARAQGFGLEVGAVGHGAGGDVRQARTCLGLAQAHGAGEAAVELVLGKNFFLQLGAVHHEQIGVAGGQHARANADRSAGKKRIGGGFYAVGQLHAAHLVVLGGAEHA